MFPFQMAFLWLINRGDPNHLRYLGCSSKRSFRVGGPRAGDLGRADGASTLMSGTRGEGQEILRMDVPLAVTPPKTNGCPLKINGWFRCISY